MPPCGVKLKPYSCHRCHAKKVKCTGGKPCQNCLQAEQGSNCLYPERNRTLKVTQKFIDGLYEQIDRLKEQQTTLHPAVHNTGADSIGPDHQPEDASPRISPPRPTELSGGPSPLPKTNAEGDTLQRFLPPNEAPWFDNRNVFRTPILISEAADTVFSTRFRQVMSDPRVPEPTHLLRLNYATDDSLVALAGANTPWPNNTRAKFLLEAALKYIARSCYIVSPGVVRESLTHTSLSDTHSDPFLCCKLWVLFAIGELSTSRAVVKQSYPGMAYFAQASKMLGYFNERPATDTVETLLLLSLYSLAVNRRYSAYILSGTAMRTAIVLGLHFNISPMELPDPYTREHRKRLFWTAYIFDRLWATNLGYPLAIQDVEIEVSLPSHVPVNTTSETERDPRDSLDCQYYAAWIELVRHQANVVRSVYLLRRQGGDAQLSARLQQTLQDLQAWGDQLPNHLKIDLPPDEPTNWRAVSLNLCFYQSIIVATRPILLHVLRFQIAASRGDSASSQASASAIALSEACVRCARHSVQLLAQSWIDGSFITFDCFFTQYLFSSLVILAISIKLEGADNQVDRDNFAQATQLLTELKDVGNFAAQEYCHHVEAIEITLANAAPMLDLGRVQVPDTSTVPVEAEFQIPELSLTAPPWSHSSLNQLLCQPELDMQFLEEAIRDTYSQEIYRSDDAFTN
ncbi:unnamed protein product [Penicillium olsonii]|nr:unnamed protein product [Penicillium olsonii]